MVQTAADGSVHVASEGGGYTLKLPRGFTVDCERDEAFADLGLVSAEYEQPSVGLVNVLLFEVPATNTEDAHDMLLEQFRRLDADSFGITAANVQTIAAGPEGRELRCYGGPASGEFDSGHYYACIGVEQRDDGSMLGSVSRVFASSEEWRVNGDGDVHMIQALSRAWTLTSKGSSTLAPPTSAPVLGCAARLGVDPQALADACGLGPLFTYNELHEYCELVFSTPDGQPGAIVTLRELRNRDTEAAWSIHRASLGATPGQTVGEVPGIPGSHWSSYAGYRWSFVPGWTHARRIVWFEADCAPERMMPALQSMVDAPQPAPEPAPRWVTSGAVSPSLASEYGGRSDLGIDDLGSRRLPDRAKKLIVTLIGAAARDDQALARILLSPGAGFGLPDRREFNAWSIAEGDNFAAFMAALRGVASRFPADAEFSCPAIPREFIDGVAQGEHPMWCSYQSADALDLLVFRLLVVHGVAYVDYVGMFEAKPAHSLAPPIPELSSAQSTELLPPLTPGTAMEVPSPTRAPAPR